MPDRSPLLDLPYIQPAQAQKHVTHNEALRALDALVQLAVQSRSQATPPATPVPAQRYIVAAGAQGDWTGHEDMLAVFDENAWSFYPPQTGWHAYVMDEDMSALWDGVQWREATQAASDDLSAQTLGLNTSADTTNRLSVAADATLLTHAGTDHRLKVNKATDTDTASLLFQSGFTGHAEMGLTGGTDFALRVSADGTTFTDALSADAATGTLNAPAGIRFGSSTLGDYEEGTWIPRLTFDDDDLGMTYSLQEGTYVRIGKLVMLQCAITLSRRGTSTGAAEIQDLPFDVDPLYFPGEISFVSGVWGLTLPKCQASSSRKIQLSQSGPGGLSNMVHSNFSHVADFRITLMHTV